MIKYEQDTISLLDIPNIPKKEWDGQSSFQKGVAILEMLHGDECYAIASFNAETDKSPRIIKVFDNDPFKGIKAIFVVPDYMPTFDEIQDFDMDDNSKDAAAAILKEANDAERNDADTTLPDQGNEYLFDFIHNDDEARAFIASYNNKNRIKGRVPTTHDGIITRLSVIYHDGSKKNGKKRK